VSELRIQQEDGRDLSSNRQTVKGVPDGFDYASVAERIASGDRSAEELLVAELQPGLRAMLIARTRDRELACDLLQETLWETIAALRKGALREPAKLPGFVMGIARNLVNRQFRTSQRRPPMIELPDDLPAAVVRPTFDEEQERMAAVSAALQEIDADDRLLLQDLLVNGVSPAAIAARQGLNVEAVRKRKSRALSRLRKAVPGASR